MSTDKENKSHYRFRDKLVLYNIPPEIKNLFKTYCYRRGTTMTGELKRFMIECAKIESEYALSLAMRPGAKKSKTTPSLGIGEKINAEQHKINKMLQEAAEEQQEDIQDTHNIYLMLHGQYPENEEDVDELS